MREPKRIKTICELIDKAMMIETDIRFGQMLVDCGYIEEKITDHGLRITVDPYYHEDEKLIYCLDKYIKKYSK